MTARALNYAEFEIQVRLTPKGKYLKMCEVYHLYLLYRATNALGG